VVCVCSRSACCTYVEGKIEVMIAWTAREIEGRGVNCVVMLAAAEQHMEWERDTREQARASLDGAHPAHPDSIPQPYTEPRFGSTRIEMKKEKKRNMTREPNVALRNHMIDHSTVVLKLASHSTHINWRL